LQSIHIPKNVSNIGEAAFTGTVSISIDANNKNFKIDQFGVLTDVKNKKLLYAPPRGITKYSIPSNVTSIGNDAFSECNDLVELNIHNGVTNIKECALRYCRNLKKINLPEGLLEIGECSFMGCSKITEVLIPASVRTLGEGAFCEVQTVRIAHANKFFKTDKFGAIIDTYRKILLWIPPQLTNYTVPHGVKTIGRFAGKKRQLAYVTIPDTVTKIGEYAFCGCKNLINIEIPNSISVIRHNAFQDCKQMKDILVPEHIYGSGIMGLKNIIREI
jgi:hypothetical protein